MIRISDKNFQKVFKVLAIDFNVFHILRFIFIFFILLQYYLFFSISIGYLAVTYCIQFLAKIKQHDWFTKKDNYNIILENTSSITDSLIIHFILEFPLKYLKIMKKTNKGTLSIQQKGVRAFSKYKGYTPWINTDRPIYSY